jgi:hypothetical protein
MEAKSHRTSESRRTFAAVAIALVAATVTAGVALGHHQEADMAPRGAAAPAPVPAAAATPGHDPSLPDAAELRADPRATAEDSAPTF